MGIQGLLKALAPLLLDDDNGSKPCFNIRQFANQSLAVDASSWLFKGQCLISNIFSFCLVPLLFQGPHSLLLFLFYTLAAYSCAERLVEKSLELSDQPVDVQCEQIICRYFVSRCEELLRYASIRSIYIVFDGKRCPLKEITNKDREKKRMINLEEARKLKNDGRHAEANEKYKACLKIAPWMSNSVARAIEAKWGKVSNHVQGGQQPPVIPLVAPYEADAQLAKLCLDGLCDAVVTEVSQVSSDSLDI